MDVLAKKEKGQPIRSWNKKDIRYDRGVETGTEKWPSHRNLLYTFILLSRYLTIRGMSPQTRIFKYKI